ncbi:MAG: xanthine dehydrogenase family protein subunit M [Rhodospirillales bacterium]|nr:xanthine dehydrogenase family protein subunit M [Rhodospirillales bacterium]
MYNFDYEKAASADDAVKAAGGSDDVMFLAGGMTLIPTLKLRLTQPEKVVDVGGIGDMKGISVSGDTVTIGAATTHADVAGSDDVKKAIPALAKLASLIGDQQVRNRGTIGGSIANADPAADYPAAVVGLGATVKTNKREIAGDDFFTAMFETALEPGELITSVSFPVPEKADYQKLANPASGYAMVGVMVAKTKDGVRVGVTGAGPSAFRASAIEDALGSDFSSDAAKGVTMSSDDLNNDLHATAEYRASCISTLAARAVKAIG